MNAANQRLPMIALELIRFVGRNARGQAKAEYRCQCGSIFTALEYNVKSGGTRSCGCAWRQLIGKSNTTHGDARNPQAPEYKSWCGIKSRCFNKSNDAFPRYGGRGITMHHEWVDSYESFLSYVGRRPSSAHTIDRIDNNRNYEPGNIRWATPQQQARNTRGNRIISFRGVTKLLCEWAKDLGIHESSLCERLAKWPLDKALTEPKKSIQRHRIQAEKRAV
jgi:hypothetical protein